MKALLSSEISINIYQTIPSHIPDDSNVHSHRQDDVKSQKENYICVVESDLTAAVMKSSVSWDTRITPYSLVKFSGLFARNQHQADTDLLHGLFFGSEDGGELFLRNVCWLSTEYTTLYPSIERTLEVRFVVRVL
jgi:hypothetical protein